MNIDTIAKFSSALSPLVALGGALFVAHKTFKLNQRKHRLEQKNRTLDLCAKLSTIESATDSEISIIHHAFYDYANKSVDPKCILICYENKLKPDLIEHLAIVGSWVKWDSKVQKCIRAKGSEKRDNAKIALGMLMVLASCAPIVLTQIFLFPDLAEHYKSDHDTRRLFGLALFYLYLLIFPIGVFAFWLPIINRIHSIKALTKN